MKTITDSVFVINDDGSFDIDREERRDLGTVRALPLKRPRALSTASSCTLRNLTHDASEPDIQTRESHRAGGNFMIRSSVEPDLQIIEGPAETKKLDAPPQKRIQSNTARLEASQLSPTHQQELSPTAFDVDGFEELKYGPGGIIDIDELEERFEAEFYGAASQEQARAQPRAARNLPICFPQVEIETYSVQSVNLKKGKTVEFLNGDFLKIGKIIENSETGEVVVRGWRLKRCSQLHGLLPKKLNELCFVLEVELDDPRPVLEQSMVQVGLEGLVKIRHLVLTNYPHPHLGFSRAGLPYDNQEENLEFVKDYERLVARWKFITFYDNAAEHSRTPIYPINIRKILLTGLTEEECAPACYMDPATLRHQWRGETVIGGAGVATRVPQTAAPMSRDQHGGGDPYECPKCGGGFDRAEKLLEHHQAAHEQPHGRTRSRSRCLPPRARRGPVIEIVDDDEEETADSPRRMRARRGDIRDIRVGLDPILRFDGEPIRDHDRPCMVGRKGRRIEVDLTTPEPEPAAAVRQPSGVRRGGRVSVSLSRTERPRDANSHANANANANADAGSRASGSRSGSRYTYGDAFCGAGGTTRGAVAAGLEVSWGLDLDKNAGQTWKANFAGATTATTHYEMWAHDLVSTINARRTKDLRVDVLHLSPPCQVFSPVHTRVGRHDQQNFDSLFACDALVHQARPRIITLEQTFGILHPKFQAAFYSLIQTFTSYGYAVSYQIVEFSRYGLAQSRRRLIIVAACPGETLPQVPDYTHSASRSSSSSSSSSRGLYLTSHAPPNRHLNLHPLTSVRSVLDQIPIDSPNHHLGEAAGRGTLHAPWDASGVIPTITCNGGDRGHPDGQRGLTLRELAALQSFPHHHVFHGNAIKKQIGNAVPPLIAEILFRAIVRHLREVDGAEGGEGRA